MATLASQIASDASAVFMNTDDFATSIEHYRGEGYSSAELIVGVMDTDQIADDPGSLDTEQGIRQRQRGVLTLLATVTVDTESQAGQYPSLFKIDGDYWYARKVLGKDQAMQSVEVIRTERKATRRAESK